MYDLGMLEFHDFGLFVSLSPRLDEVFKLLGAFRLGLLSEFDILLS